MNQILRFRPNILKVIWIIAEAGENGSHFFACSHTCSQFDVRIAVFHVAASVSSSCTTGRDSVARSQLASCFEIFCAACQKLYMAMRRSELEFITKLGMFIFISFAVSCKRFWHNSLNFAQAHCVSQTCWQSCTSSGRHFGAFSPLLAMGARIFAITFRQKDMA